MTMDRYAKIAEKIVAGPVARWVSEVPYALSVMMGNIPAFNSYNGALLFIQRGQAFLKQRKREIIEKMGQADYDAAVKAFDEFSDTWDKVGKAELAVEESRRELDQLKLKYKGLRDRMS